MLSLRDLQIQFEIDLFNGDAAKGAYIRKDGISVKERIAIYRNNVFSNYRKALSAVYPVVERLVGEQFFRQTADSYIDAYPSLSGDLNQYGANFSQFMVSYEPVKRLPYLSDVARLEWLVELVFHASDHVPRVLEKLSNIPEEKYGELRFSLHPASQLFQSNFPTATIWQVNQPDWQGDCAVDLQSGGCELLVFRKDFSIIVKPLTKAEYVMLHGLAAGKDINTTFCKAFEIQNDLDLGSFLQQMIHDGVLVDVIV
ncbi:MAG: hypothetical protein BVN34_00825 [Proteobacteria bacterium ST_bin12]|nr:MAG: hypothetical protein BVN34_00825 [Proteobacteria bacterium ST_bin12]